jgi:hypothetical protein
MGKEKKFGRVEFADKGFKVVPLTNNGKPTGKYGIIAGKYLVSEQASLKDSIEKLKDENFKPLKKNKKF